MSHSVKHMGEAAVFLFMVAILGLATVSATMLQEVNIGDVAELHCLSSDDNHRFQFWQLHSENRIIGPDNQFNRDKYKYDVLTGTLKIRGVSSSEHGLYTCVCKHLTNNSFQLETIELVVKKDWEEVYETDPYTNVFRLVMILAVLLVVAALALVLYNMRMDRSARFRALADEESPDEAGPSYEPATRDRPMSDLDSHGLDTELPRPTIFTDIRLSDTGI